jgi:hypothetical protein
MWVHSSHGCSRYGPAFKNGYAELITLPGIDLGTPRFEAYDPHQCRAARDMNDCQAPTRLLVPQSACAGYVHMAHTTECEQTLRHNTVRPQECLHFLVYHFSLILPIIKPNMPLLGMNGPWLRAPPGIDPETSRLEA